MIRGWFGESTETVIEHDLREYYEDQVKNKTFIEPYNIKQVLEDILQDPSKYPDA